MPSSPRFQNRVCAYFVFYSFVAVSSRATGIMAVIGKSRKEFELSMMIITFWMRSLVMTSYFRKNEKERKGRRDRTSYFIEEMLETFFFFLIK